MVVEQLPHSSELYSLSSEQRSAQMSLHTRLGSLLVYETVSGHPLQLERGYTPTQQELASLVEKRGEDLYWNRLAATTERACQDHWLQEFQKSDYQGRTVEEKQALATEHWIRDNQRWLNESRAQMDPTVIAYLEEGFLAVGIDIAGEHIEDQLRQFLSRYNPQGGGGRRYVEALARSCVQRNGAFDYVRFREIKDVMAGFTVGNFGDTDEVEKLFRGYLEGYVTVEYAVHDPLLQSEVLRSVGEQVQITQSDEVALLRQRESEQAAAEQRRSLEIEQHDFAAEFLRPLAASLRRCGIRVEYVNPVPLGEGKFHKVFAYNEPNQPKRVIKVPNPKDLFTMTDGPGEEQKNFELTRRAFSGYEVDSEVRVDPEQSEQYCVVQDLVEGVPLTPKMCQENPDLRRQLAEIVQDNRNLYQREKITLDIVGFAAVESWAKRQYKKLFQVDEQFTIANIFVDRFGKLKIVDSEYFYAESDDLKKRAQAFACMHANNWFMKHYFGLDILQ